MSGEVMSKKRAARIERRKSKIAAIFKVEGKSEGEKKKEQEDEPSEKQLKLSDEEYKTLKAKLRGIKRLTQYTPVFRLVHIGLSASLNLPKASRIPVLATDVQTLFLYTVIGESRYERYKWCSLNKWNNLTQTLILIIEDVSVDDFENNTDAFSETSKIFQDGVEMSNPTSDGFSLDLALAYVPISHAMKSTVMAGYPSLQAACKDGYIYGVSDSPLKKDIDKISSESHSEKISTINLGQSNLGLNEKATQAKSQTHGEKVSMNSLSNNAIEENATSDLMKVDVSTVNDHDDSITREDESRCSRLELLLNATQLISELYPLPGNEECCNFVFTQSKYDPVTDQSPMFSIDCEWCICVDGSYGLARVAVVDENLKTLYHTYVKPDVAIADYVTRYSGITEELLADVKKTPSDVQQDLRTLLPPDAILVGQSLQSDLKALKMFHPYIIDTSVIFNMTGSRSFKSKLKVLAASFCGRRIQDSSDGHDPTEDAIAAMELVLTKIKMGAEFGDIVLVRDSFSNSSEKVNNQENLIHMKLFTFIQSHNKSAALIITEPSAERSYRPGLLKLNSAVIKKKKDDEPLAKPVQILVANDLKEAVSVTSCSRFNNDFILVHTSLGKVNSDCKEKLKELDKAIAEIYDGVSLNGMMIVIFGGKSNPVQNGACLVRVNKSRVI